MKNGLVKTCGNLYVPCLQEQKTENRSAIILPNWTIFYDFHTRKIITTEKIVIYKIEV